MAQIAHKMPRPSTNRDTSAIDKAFEAFDPVVAVRSVLAKTTDSDYWEYAAFKWANLGKWDEVRAIQSKAPEAAREYIERLIAWRASHDAR